MNYVIFNKDGSVKNFYFTEIITKNSNTSEIFAGVDGLSNESYTASANFELPNGDANTLLGTPSSEEIDGSTFYGYRFNLTAQQTAVEGNVFCSIVLRNAQKVLYTYEVILTINPSVGDPNETAISVAQYNNLQSTLASLQPKYVIHNARFYTSQTDANNDIANIVTNQCVIIADVTNPDSIPTVWFKNASGTLQALNTFSQMVDIDAVATSHSLLPTDDPSVDVSVTTIDKTHYRLNFSFGIPKGEKGDPGETGATGDPAGFGSITASVVANNPDNPPRVEVVTDPTSPNTAKSFQFNFYDIKGEKGDPGDDGTSFVITGEVASVSLLPSVADTALGTAYFVGTQNPKNVYVCLEVEGVKQWVDEGDLEGPQGEQGEKGDTGATGPAPTIQTIAGAHINETGTPSVIVTQQGNVATLTFDYLKGAQGQQGEQGEQGEKGDKGDTGNGIERMTADQSGELYVEYTDGTTQDVGMIGQGVVVVDSQFDENSTNPLQNKVITERWKEIDSASVDVLDYSMAKVSGKDDGLALPEESQLELKSLRGNTIAWNQIVQNGNFASTDGWTASNGVSLTAQDNVGTLNVDTPTSNSLLRRNIAGAGETSHKYLYVSFIKVPVATEVSYNQAGSRFAITNITTPNVWTALAWIGNASNTYSNIGWQIDTSGMSANDKIQIRDFSIIDITRLYGAGNEPTSVTDPKAQWAINYALKHPAYDAGSLVSVNMSAFETEDFNQWDEEWELGTINTSTGVKESASNRIRSKNFIRVKPNENYYATFTNDAINGIKPFYYDKAYNFIGCESEFSYTFQGNFTTPSNCSYILFIETSSYGKTYNHDICINISDSSLNGTYKPYEKNTYPISFHGKSAGSVYDERKADGTDITRIGSVDLSSLEWNTTSVANMFACIGLQSLIKKPSSNSVVANIISNKLTPDTANNVYAKSTQSIIGVVSSNGGLWCYISDNVSTVEQLITALNGAYLYYELATPVQSVNDPLPNAIKVYQDGTEWQINDGAPCGMEKDYDVSIKGQVITNVRVDARQEEEINAQGAEVNSLKQTDLKTLYHLGAYDSVDTSNEDYDVITRKTGYLDLASIVLNYYGNENTWESYALHGKMPIPSTSEVAHCKWSDGEVVAYNDLSGATQLAISNTGTIVIINGSSTTPPSGLLEYETISSYTEKVIKNQPLSTLDQAGENWLRGEYEKTLNLWDEQWEAGSYSSETGEKITSSGGGRSKNFIAVEPITSYFLKAPSTAYAFFYGADKSYIGYLANVNDTAFTTPSGCYYMTFAYFSTTYNNDVIIAKGNQPIPYQPYNGKVLHAIDVEGVKLWENGNPSATFANQRVSTASLSGYSRIAVEFSLSPNDGTSLLVYSKTGSGNASFVSDVYVGRSFEKVNDTVISFLAGYRNGVENNDRVIPLAIYGIK